MEPFCRTDIWRRAERARPVKKRGLFQQGFDTVEQTLRFGDRRKARDTLTIGGEQEFGEIPFDAAAAQNAGRQAFQFVEQRMGAGAVDLYFLLNSGKLTP